MRGKTMATGFVVAFLLAFACEKAASQDFIRYNITWDRYWLANNLVNHTLRVRLSDALQFFCRIEDTEPQADRVENLILLEEEQHLLNCDVGPTGEGNHLGRCRHNNSVIDVPIVSFGLFVLATFEAGRTYYFTSFSDGTQNSAETDRSRGGACRADPPLRLTVIVEATPSSLPSSSATVTSFATSSTRDVASIIPTSSVVIPSSSSQVAQPTSTVPPTLPSPPPSPEALSSAGQLSSLLCVTLISLVITCILTS